MPPRGESLTQLLGYFAANTRTFAPALTTAEADKAKAQLNAAGKKPVDVAPCATAPVIQESPYFGLAARKLVIQPCEKQLGLRFKLGEFKVGDAKKDVHEVLTLPIAAIVPAPKADPVTKTTTTPPLPHLTLVRQVQNVAEIAGITTITVGVEKLTDQSATLTVANADIVSAIDGNSVPLAILAGGQVTVTQDSNITFQLRNADRTKVNVTAEGKNGSQSTGKVAFEANFTVKTQSESQKK